jgi:hypothetical protein
LSEERTHAKGDRKAKLQEQYAKYIASNAWNQDSTLISTQSKNA